MHVQCWWNAVASLRRVSGSMPSRHERSELATECKCGAFLFACASPAVATGVAVGVVAAAAALAVVALSISCFCERTAARVMF